MDDSIGIIRPIQDEKLSYNDWDKRSCNEMRVFVAQKKRYDSWTMWHIMIDVKNFLTRVREEALKYEEDAVLVAESRHVLLVVIIIRQ